jgi:hypothetical protein
MNRKIARLNVQAHCESQNVPGKTVPRNLLFAVTVPADFKKRRYGDSNPGWRIESPLS